MTLIVSSWPTSKVGFSPTQDRHDSHPWSDKSGGPMSQSVHRDVTSQLTSQTRPRLRLTSGCNDLLQFLFNRRINIKSQGWSDLKRLNLRSADTHSKKCRFCRRVTLASWPSLTLQLQLPWLQVLRLQLLLSISRNPKLPIDPSQLSFRMCEAGMKKPNPSKVQYVNLICSQLISLRPLTNLILCCINLACMHGTQNISAYIRHIPHPTHSTVLLHSSVFAPSNVTRPPTKGDEKLLKHGNARVASRTTLQKFRLGKCKIHCCPYSMLSKTSATVHRCLWTAAKLYQQIKDISRVRNKNISTDLREMSLIRPNHVTLPGLSAQDLGQFLLQFLDRILRPLFCLGQAEGGEGRGSSWLLKFKNRLQKVPSLTLEAFSSQQ